MPTHLRHYAINRHINMVVDINWDTSAKIRRARSAKFRRDRSNFKNLCFSVIVKSS